MTPPITSICHSYPCPGELALDAPRLRRQATLPVAGDPVVDTLWRHTTSRRATSTTFHPPCRAAADAGIH
jgi:hypothetical protein